jgi:1-deoxy-D-xylulose-5-phosphate synthase
MKKQPPLLETIGGPSDLKRLGVEEMEELARQIRAFILEKLSPVGGHLASSLGVVELTLALHAVFDTPADKIIWDVGHQSYPHKILTGRREGFCTIRQKGGLSGFPKREESPYDAFGVGHAATSISAGLGMAVGRDLRGRRNKVVAVIGDASIASGMAFEGLNHAGHLKSDLIVVLNDNEMSISRNVGALASYLSRVLSGNVYTKFRQDVQGILSAVPGGRPVARLARKVEEHAKGFLTPGMLFEELGFNYVGPIDGHNIAHLTTAFRNVSKFDKPVLVHVVTRKGKGFEPAESEPAAYHGVGPFDPVDGLPEGKSGGVPTYTAVFGATMVRLAEKNPRILAITAAMAEGTGLLCFSEKFPDRFFDVGIAEEHAVTFAAGLATEGWRPVVAIYSTFLQRSYDQIVHDVALQKLPVVFALDRAGMVGADGPTHHGAFDLSFLRHIPDLAVLAPSDEDELQHALATALSLDSPSALRYPRGSAVGVPMAEEPTPWPVGKGRIVLDGGEGSVAILCAGTALSAAREAARLAASEGVSVTVFDARFVKPLDRETILSLASRSSALVTLEENARLGGFGASVLELLADADALRVPVRVLGLADRFFPHATQAELRREAGIDAESVRAVVVELAGRGKAR